MPFGGDFPGIHTENKTKENCRSLSTGIKAQSCANQVNLNLIDVNLTGSFVANHGEDKHFYGNSWLCLKGV